MLEDGLFVGEGVRWQKFEALFDTSRIFEHSHQDKVEPGCAASAAGERCAVRTGRGSALKQTMFAPSIEARTDSHYKSSVGKVIY